MALVAGARQRCILSAYHSLNESTICDGEYGMRFLLMAMTIALSACEAGSSVQPGGAADVNGTGSAVSSITGNSTTGSLSSRAPAVDAEASDASVTVSATAGESSADVNGDATVPAPSLSGSGAPSSSVSHSDAGSTAYEPVTLDETTPIGLSGREAMMALSGNYAGVLFYNDETPDADIVTLRIAVNCDGRPIPDGSVFGGGAQAVLGRLDPDGQLALAICCEFTLESEDKFAVSHQDVVLRLYEREKAQFSWLSPFQDPETAAEPRPRTFSGTAYAWRHLLQLSITTSGVHGVYEYANLR